MMSIVRTAQLRYAIRKAQPPGSQQNEDHSFVIKRSPEQCDCPYWFFIFALRSIECCIIYVLHNIVTFPASCGMVRTWEMLRECGEIFRHWSSGACGRRGC